MNIVDELSVWLIWWLIEILILVLVLIRNNLMGKQDRKRYVLDKWEKHAVIVMMITIILIGITSMINDDKWRNMTSIFYAVLFFTGGLWISRKFNDDTNTKLEIIDDRLKRIQERLDGLYKK